jgi:hypothetical protein
MGILNEISIGRNPATAKSKALPVYHNSKTSRLSWW